MMIDFPETKVVSIPCTPLEGMEIVHLSDLHIDHKTPIKVLEKLVTIVNSISPDIVVITGDIIDTNPLDIADKLMLFKKICSPIYFVSGNHDLRWLSLLVTLLSSETVHFMDNRYHCLYYQDQPYYLAGIADRFANFFGIKRTSNTLESINSHKIPLIFLAHQPKDYRLALRLGSSVFLTGHTHGGQIFPFHLLVRMVQPFLNGIHHKDQMYIYVSRGFGTWGVPFRLLAPSEVTHIKMCAEMV